MGHCTVLYLLANGSSFSSPVDGKWCLLVTTLCIMYSSSHAMPNSFTEMGFCHFFQRSDGYHGTPDDFRTVLYFIIAALFVYWCRWKGLLLCVPFLNKSAVTMVTFNSAHDILWFHNFVFMYEKAISEAVNKAFRIKKKRSITFYLLVRYPLLC